MDDQRQAASWVLDMLQKIEALFSEVNGAMHEVLFMNFWFYFLICVNVYCLEFDGDEFFNQTHYCSLS